MIKQEFIIQVQSTLRKSLWYDVVRDIPTLPKAKAKFKAMRADYDRVPSGKQLVLRLIGRQTIITECPISP